MRKAISFILSAGMITAALWAGAGCGESSADGSAESSSRIEIYMPDGAPALALAKAMHEEKDDEAEYHVVDSSLIQTYVTGAEPKADLCLLPVNLASKLLGSGETYQMLGTVTHGNLYMLSVDSVEYTADNLDELVGKTVGVVNLQNVPGLTFKVILNEILGEGIWQELENDGEPASDKVNLKAITRDQVLPATGLDCYIAPEPAASVKADKTALGFVGDLQELYGGDKGYPQAVLVAKTSFIAERAEWIESFTADLSLAGEWLANTEAGVIVSAVSAHLTEGLTPSLSEENLSPTAIGHSGIRFERAADCKEEVKAFLDKLIAVNGGAASAVADAFFYGA